MSGASLRCNLLTCRKILEETALVTSCSHIFCQQHGQVSMKNAKCLACSSSFRNKYDYNIVDLQPTDQYKSMIITGMNPDQILEIADRSITFYIYQLSNECRLKDDMLKQIKEEKQNLQNYCNSLKGGFKSDLDNVQRIAKGLKEELAEKNAQLERQREQITQYSRINKKLQMELSTCKRHIATMKMQESPNAMETTPVRNRFGLNSGPNRSNGNDFNFLQEDSEESSTAFTPRWGPHPRFSE